MSLLGSTFRLGTSGDPGDLDIFDATRAIRRFQYDIASGDRQAQAVLANAFGIADAAITERVNSLTTKIGAAQAAGTPITEAWLYQVGRLDQLSAFAAAQYTKVGVQLNQAVTSGERQAISTGIDATQRLISQQLLQNPPLAGHLGARLDFAHLDPKQFTNLVGMLQTGAPLRNLTFSNLTVGGAESMAKALVRGSLQGLAPRDIARQVAVEQNLTRARALTIARTEILRAARSASIAAMNANAHLVNGWRWSAHLDRHTCGSCIVRQGMLFPTDAEFETHPNCRCAPVPQTKSWGEINPDLAGLPSTDIEPFIPKADDWLRQMSRADLNRAFGPTRASMIQGGYLKSADLIAASHNGAWGYTPRLPSVDDMKYLAGTRGWTAAPKAPPVATTAPVNDEAAMARIAHTKASNPDVEAVMQRGLTSLKQLQDDLQKIVDERDRTTDPARISELNTRARLRVDQWRREMADLADQVRTITAKDLEYMTGRHLTATQAKSLLELMKGEDAYLKAWQNTLLKEYLYMPSRLSGMVLGESSLARLADSLRFARSDRMAVLSAFIGFRDRLMLNRPTLGSPLFAGSRQVYTKGTLAKALPVHDNLMAMSEWMEKTFGLRTNWNGGLGFGGTGAGAAGTFGWDKVISVHTDYMKGLRGLANQTKVIFHEAFHGISVGAGDPRIYARYRGWEEGVVERASQVWEADILKVLGHPPSNKGYSTYDRYTGALEELRRLAGMSEKEFYSRLIGTDLAARPALVRTWLDSAKVSPYDYQPIMRKLSVDTGERGIPPGSTVGTAPATALRQPVPTRITSAQAWQDSLTPDELYTLKVYASSGYRDINTALRAASTGDAALTREILAIDAALARSALPVDTTLYRAAPASAFEGVQVGSVFTDRAYGSTSLSPVIQQDFANYLKEAGDTPVYITINAPAGTSGGYISGILPSMNEQEWLLARGTQYRVTSLTKSGDGWQMTMDVL